MSVCWPTAQLRAAQELYAALHEERAFHDGTFARWSEKRSHDFPFRFDDGVSFWLSPVDLPEPFDWLGRGQDKQDPGEGN